MPAGDSCFLPFPEEEVDSEVVKQGQELNQPVSRQAHPLLFTSTGTHKLLARQACTSPAKDVCVACLLLIHGLAGWCAGLCLRKH